MAETTLPVDRIGGGAVERAGFWRRVRIRPWMLAAAVVVALVAAEALVRTKDAARGYAPNARAAWYWLFEQDPFLGYRGRANASTWFAPPGSGARHRFAGHAVHGQRGVGHGAGA